MADKASKATTKEGRLARKERHQQEKEACSDEGTLLYDPGIAN